MGEVYRATDTRLHRDVAVKILPEPFAMDAERLARFRREAQVLASLNHPNIAAIHGIEEFGGTHALVLELVEGPTLADRIAQGPVPLDEALPIARQIADALEAAHEHGVVHRDLKPANIKVRADGTVKVLDFGLAKALEGEPTRGAAASISPTITSPAATRLGVILGTAAYMSPEQARGKAVDKRTDIWAFGCVLYEMLTGRRPFDGDDVTDVLARVLERDVEFGALPATTPPAIVRLLRRTLEKDRRRRLPDIAVARLEIDEAENRSDPGHAVPIGTSRGLSRGERLLWAGALAAGIVLTIVGVRYGQPAGTAAPEMRLQIDTPRGTVGQGRFAISPDGRSVLFQSAPPGRRTPQLWIRSLAEEIAQPVPGTDGAGDAFWSPDGRSIAFVARGELKRLELSDGRIQTLANASIGSGGAWSAEGGILSVDVRAVDQQVVDVEPLVRLTTSFTGPLYRIAATGGEVTAVTQIDPPQTGGHVLPAFLPDGRHFLFYAFGSPEGKGIYLGSLGSNETRRLLETDSGAIFVPPDLIAFEQEGSLVARRLDLASQTLEPDTITVARQVASDVINAYVATAAGPGGTIAYRSRPEERHLTWFDREGRQTGVLGDSDSAQPGGPRMSPDGRTVAMPRTVDGNTDIWLLDVARATLRPLTRDPGGDGGPVWSPDGTRIAFHSDRRAGNLDLYEKEVNGSKPETILLQTQEDKNVNDWSPDDRYIVYRGIDPVTGNDLWALPLFGDRKPLPVARTTASELAPRVSPDGRWIAYQSNESGRAEIYVQPFPGTVPRLQVSAEGGFGPQWRGDGRELFFVSPDETMMAVSMVSAGATIQAGAPVALFAKPFGGYAVTADGQRFLVGVVSADGSPITILLNWAGARR